MSAAPVRIAYRVPNAVRVPPAGGWGSIVAHKRLGADLFLLGFLHYQEEVECFGKRVLPLVRELEAQLPHSGPKSVSVAVPA
jgi:hypothetical protein